MKDKISQFCYNVFICTIGQIKYTNENVKSVFSETLISKSPQG